MEWRMRHFPHIRFPSPRYRNRTANDVQKETLRVNASRRIRLKTFLTTRSVYENTCACVREYAHPGVSLDFLAASLFCRYFLLIRYGFRYSAEALNPDVAIPQRRSQMMSDWGIWRIWRTRLEIERVKRRDKIRARVARRFVRPSWYRCPSGNRLGRKLVGHYGQASRKYAPLFTQFR